MKWKSDKKWNKEIEATDKKKGLRKSRVNKDNKKRRLEKEGTETSGKKNNKLKAGREQKTDSEN